MAENDGDKPYAGPQHDEQWFSKDPVAREIRIICGRIIAAYNKLAPLGQDTGIVPKDEIGEIMHELVISFHELNELEVTKDIHVGDKPETFNNPRKLAEYVGGQLLHLQHIPLTTDMERNKQAEYLNLEDGIADPNQVWPDEIQNMRIQAGSIWTAEQMLGFDDTEQEAPI